MLLRRALPEDRPSLCRIHALAFARPGDGRPPAEVPLLERLLDDGDVVPALSIVAVADGELVGHVVCSRAAVGAVTAVGLGPVGVLPSRQGRGVGTALLHAVIGAADALDLPLVGLLGAPELYGRFGFVASRTVGIEPPEPAWGAHFQVRPLAAYRPSVVGRFRYAPAFDAL